MYMVEDFSVLLARRQAPSLLDPLHVVKVNLGMLSGILEAFLVLVLGALVSFLCISHAKLPVHLGEIQ